MKNFSINSFWNICPSFDSFFSLVEGWNWIRITITLYRLIFYEFRKVDFIKFPCKGRELIIEHFTRTKMQKRTEQPFEFVEILILRLISQGLFFCNLWELTGYVVTNPLRGVLPNALSCVPDRKLLIKIMKWLFNFSLLFRKYVY